MDTVYLRALELEDIDRTHKWHNDQELYGWLVGPYRYVARAAEEAWLRKRTDYSPDQINLAICLADGGQHIGNIYLQDIDWIARHAGLGIFIGEPEYRSKGYGTEALRLAVRHAFQDLGLQRVYLYVLEDNERAIKTYEKCGFVVEGRLRRHAFKMGKLKDIIVMGMCAYDPTTDT